MAATSFKRSLVTTPSPKYDSFLVGNDPYLPSTFELIETITVGAGGASSVTFSSIPSTYKHLQVRGICRTTDSTVNSWWATTIRFNSDTGSNYAYHILSGNGTSASSGNGTSQTAGLIGEAITDGSLANTYGASVTDILDYTNTSKYKTVRSLSGLDGNGFGEVALWSSLWQSTSAISSITLSQNWGSPNFKQYSSFSLYGIRG